MMTKKVFLTILLTFGVAVSYAQSPKPSPKAMKNKRPHYLSLGPVLGFGHSWVSNMGGTMRFMPSGSIGVGMVYAKHEHWGWGAQLSFTSEGYYTNYNGFNAMGVPGYLRMPVRAYYFFGDYKNIVRPKVYLGPSIGVKLMEQTTRDNVVAGHDMLLHTGDFRTLDFGLNAGAGVNIQLAKGTWLNLDLGYYHGLTDVLDDPAAMNIMNRNLGINAGILFGLR